MIIVYILIYIVIGCISATVVSLIDRHMDFFDDEDEFIFFALGTVVIWPIIIPLIILIGILGVLGAFFLWVRDRD